MRDQDYSEFEVAIKRNDGQELGLNIFEKIATGGVFVAKVNRGSLVDREGSIKAGDQILKVNGEDVQKSNQDYVANLLRLSKGELRLMVGRTKDREEELPENMSRVAALLANIEREGMKLEQAFNLKGGFREYDKGENDCFVEIEKGPSMQLGINIAGGRKSHLGDVPLFIASVQPDSAASGKLMPGDKILSINGQSTENKTHEKAVWMIKGSTDAILLMKVRRGDKDVRKLVEYLAETSSTVSEMISSSFNLGIMSEPSDTDSEKSAHVQVTRTVTIMPLTKAEVAKRLEIVLEQTDEGLGFSVVGGIGSMHGDLPIFVKSIYKSGPAALEGRLHSGDRILAVNGETLDGCTHQEGVALLKKAKGRVVLSVIPTG